MQMDKEGMEMGMGVGQYPSFVVHWQRWFDVPWRLQQFFTTKGKMSCEF